MMHKLTALNKRLSQFLAKQSDQNDPLHQLHKDPGFDNFQLDLETAILAQATWTATQLLDLEAKYIADDLAPMTADQVANLSLYLDRFMPSVSDAMTNEKVYQWFKQTFDYGVSTVYDAQGITANFNLTSPNYIGMIQADTNMLLDKSTLDSTTRKALIDLIATDKEQGMTVDEISADIQENFIDISATRADMIARTETTRMLNQGQYAAMKESGVTMKAWLAYGSDPCPTCLANAGDDFIPMSAMFSSGDLMPPPHPRCECSLDYMSVDIAPGDAWEGE
jgi:SPP1 gp7 family putative phage head morphogenesis protein